jgi:hypothetical protein
VTSRSRGVVPSRRRQPARMLRRDGDGTLYDVDEHRTVSLAELAEEVREGRRFRVHQHSSGRECTQQVLLEVLGAGAPAGALGTGIASAGARVGGLAGAVGTIAGAIADHRNRDETSANGAAHQGRRPRPMLELEDEG